MDTTEPLIYAVEGGIIPFASIEHKQKEHDVGTDLAVRAVIAIESKAEQLKRPTPARRHLFDFNGFAEREINTRNLGEDNHGRFYRLYSGETVSLGLGVVVELQPGWAGYVEPRGSTIRTFGRNSTLSVLNSNVPIDPGFRAEIWAELKNEGPHEFKIHKHDILFQLVRKKVDTTPFRIVKSFNELSKSDRGGGSNGSTTTK